MFASLPSKEESSLAVCLPLSCCLI